MSKSKFTFFFLLFTYFYFAIPYVNIYYPFDGSLYQNNITSINYTTNATSFCWYSLNNGTTNSSPLPAGQNFSTNIGEGEYKLIVYCNDSYGIGNNSVEFSVGNFTVTGETQVITINNSINFGRNLISYSNKLIIAEYTDSYNGLFYAGSLHYFLRNSSNIYAHVQNFYPENLSNYSYLGNFFHPLSVYKDYVFVGHRRNSEKGNYTGAAYIFRLNSSGEFEEIQRLYPEPLLNNSNYGGTINAYGDILAVSATNDNSSVVGGGSVYVYRRNSSGLYELIQKIIPSDIQDYDRFGSDVVVYGDYLFSSSTADDDVGYNSGSLYIYKRNSSGLYEPIQKVVPFDAPNPGNYEYFGTDVDFSGDYLAVGAYNKNVSNNSMGSVYIFKLNSSGLFEPLQVIEITNNTFTIYGFGYSLRLAGDYLIAGSFGDDYDGFTDAGTVYIFRKNSSGLFEFMEELRDPNPVNGGKFGASLHSYSRYIAISDHREEVNGNPYRGAVRIRKFYKYPSLNLSISPNTTINYTQKTNASCSSQSDVVLTLYMDGLAVNSSKNYVEHITGLPPGKHIYTCKTSGNDTYISRELSIAVNVVSNSIPESSKKSRNSLIPSITKKDGKVLIVVKDEKGNLLDNVKIIIRKKAGDLYYSVKTLYSKEGKAETVLEEGDYKFNFYKDGFSKKYLDFSHSLEKNEELPIKEENKPNSFEKQEIKEKKEIENKRRKETPKKEVSRESESITQNKKEGKEEIREQKDDKTIKVKEKVERCEGIEISSLCLSSLTIIALLTITIAAIFALFKLKN